MVRVLRRVTSGTPPAQRVASADSALDVRDRETRLRSGKSERLAQDADQVPVNPGSPARSLKSKPGGARSARTSADVCLEAVSSALVTNDLRREDREGVGYGKPPRHSRFKPGQSGNPKGRAKNIKNFPNILKEELEALVEVTENGRKRKLSKGQLAIKSLVHKAVKGDQRAFAEIFRQMEKHFQAPEKQETSLGASVEAASAMSPMRHLILEYFAPNEAARLDAEPSESHPAGANQTKNHKGAKS